MSLPPRVRSRENQNAPREDRAVQPIPEALDLARRMLGTRRVCRAAKAFQGNMVLRATRAETEENWHSETATPPELRGAYQWAMRDSNPRLLPCKGSTLATELIARMSPVGAGYTASFQTRFVGNGRRLAAWLQLNDVTATSAVSQGEAVSVWKPEA